MLIFFRISLFILLLAIGGTVFTILTHHKFTKIKPIYILGIGVFLAIYVILLFVDHKPKIHGWESTPFIALFHTIQIMLAGYDFEWLELVIKLDSGVVSSLPYLYLGFLFFLAPVCTFGFVLSFFESINSYLRYLFHFRSDVYVLSELSEKSITLAETVREKFPKATIIFMNTNLGSDTIPHELLCRAKAIKSAFFKKSLSDIELKLHVHSSKVTFFAISEDISLNLESSLMLIERFRERRNTELFVFATSHESELLLDAIPCGYMKVRRVNVIRSLIYSNIIKTPITNFVTEAGDRKIISPLIIGMGQYGTEIVKALLWCGQLPGYDLEINVIDKNEHTESIFRAQCPEIMELNGNDTMGEARYHLTFYNGVDIDSYDLHEIVSKLTHTSAIYVSLGDDEKNIETAISLRILFERMGLFPMIRAVVYSDVRYNTLRERNLIDYRGESYEIDIVGNIEDRFSYDAIIDEELEAAALECHLRWSNTPEEIEQAIVQFNECEYFRNSSIATAIHETYRRRENLSGDLASVIEHMRWNAYMRTEGYVFSGSRDKATRNDRAKMHHNLHRYGLLNDEDIAKDRRIANGNKQK